MKVENRLGNLRVCGWLTEKVHLGMECESCLEKVERCPKQV
jgi:hypothetical protein